MAFIEGKLDGPLYCSFCGKGRREVASMIAGASVYICDECVILALCAVAGVQPEITSTEDVRDLRGAILPLVREQVANRRER